MFPRILSWTGFILAQYHTPNFYISNGLHFEILCQSLYKENKKDLMTTEFSNKKFYKIYMYDNYPVMILDGVIQHTHLTVHSI